jgi:hypothetical protein
MEAIVNVSTEAVEAFRDQGADAQATRPWGNVLVAALSWSRPSIHPPVRFVLPPVVIRSKTSRACWRENCRFDWRRATTCCRWPTRPARRENWANETLRPARRPPATVIAPCRQ